MSPKLVKICERCDKPHGCGSAQCALCSHPPGGLCPKDHKENPWVRHDFCPTCLSKDPKERARL